MPAKYHIRTEPSPPRFRPVGRLGIVDWREDCSNCHNCVKRSCVYGLFRDESDTLRDEAGYLDYIYQCKGCLSCIQDCTKGILARVVNPEYERLGDEHYTPEVLLTTWFQADTGRIPVTGSGYGGKFSGPGFDSMWTDMSEIVRPTRDGIHGREYINTGVELGRKVRCVTFEEGKCVGDPPPGLTVSLPVLFNDIPAQYLRGCVGDAIVRAAANIDTIAIVGASAAAAGDPHQMPLVTDGDLAGVMASSAVVMVPDGENVLAVRDGLKQRNGDQIVAIRVPASPTCVARIAELVDASVEVIQLAFDPHGREAAGTRHMRDVLQDVHGMLIKAGTRDQVTLIASGGIALAEHVTKALLCGADVVAVDLPLIFALECRYCGECERGQLCPIELEKIELAPAVQRLMNLMGAWHQQLIEMLGAMGIREARRLRGETGRCMFFEDLEAETFGRLFGKRRSVQGVSDGG